MKQTTDLQAAISFVTTRIVEAALRSGEPLTDEQRDLLDNLPDYSSTSTAGNYFDPEYGTGQWAGQGAQATVGRLGSYLLCVGVHFLERRTFPADRG